MKCRDCGALLISTVVNGERLWDSFHLCAANSPVRTLAGSRDRIVFECDDCGVEYEMDAGEAPISGTCNRCTEERERDSRPDEFDRQGGT